MKRAQKSTAIRILLTGWLVLVTLASCQWISIGNPTPAAAGPTVISVSIKPDLATSATAPVLKEYPVEILPLPEPVNGIQAELSGLTWANDTLILLPQYPERFKQAASPGSFGALFAISKNEILNLLDGLSNNPFHLKTIPLFAPDLKQKINGYEGFESVVVSGEQIFFTIETHQTNGMAAFLLGGSLASDQSEIHLDTSHIQIIPAQASIPNFSDEAMTVVNNHLLTFYEANGAEIVKNPVAHEFGLDGSVQGLIPTPNLEYRITDATQADSAGKFWVINYFFPGDTKIIPLSDPIFDRYGKPTTHSRSKVVERLVQMQATDQNIQQVDQTPIYLELLSGDTARNWEGLAQLDQRGFLLVTDSYPSSLLGFVAFP